jgi:translocation and assembly module TamB
MHDTLRKTGRYSAWVAVGLLILIGFLVLMLQTQVAKDLIRDQVVSRTNAALAGRLELGRIDGNFLRTLQLEDAELYDGRGEPFARLDRVDVEFSLISLLWGELRIHRVTLEEPVVLLRRYEDGTMNVSTLTPPSDEPEPPPGEPSTFGVTVEQIQLRGGTIAWEDRAADPDPRSPRREALERALETVFEEEGAPDLYGYRAAFQREGRHLHEPPSAAAIEGLEIDARFEMNGSEDLGGTIHRLRADVLDTNTAADPFQLDVEQLSARSRPDRLGARLESLSLDGTTLIDRLSTTLHLEPGTEPPETGGFPLKLASVRLERLHVPTELGSALIPDRTLRTPLDLTLQAGGDLDRLLAHATLEVEGAGSIELAGTFDPDAESPGYRASLALSDVRPHEIVEIDGLDATLNLGLSVEGRGFDPETARANLQLGLWSSEIRAYRIERSRLRASLEAGTLQLEELTLQSPLLHLAARGRAALEGTFDLDLKARAPTPGATWSPPEGPSMTVGEARFELSTSGRLEPSAGVPDLIERLDLAADWSIRQLEAGSIAVPEYSGSLSVDVRPPDSDDAPKQVELDVQTEGRGMRLPGFELERGRVSLSGSAALRTGTGVWHEMLGASQLDLDLEAFGLKTESVALGKLRTEGRVGSDETGRSLNYRLDGRLGPLRTASLDVAQGTFDLQGGVTLGAPDAALPIEDVRLSGHVGIRQVGSTGFSTRSVDTTLDLRGAPLAPTGTVRVDASALRLGSRSFERLVFNVALPKPQSIRARLEATPIDDAAPIVLETALDYSRTFDRFELNQLDLGRTGIAIWSLARPSVVSLVEGGVSIDRFQLRESQQSLAIDGTFRTEGAASLDVTLEALDLGSLQRLADLELTTPLDGRLSTRLRLRGTSRAPRASVGIEAMDVQWGPVEDVSLEMQLAYADALVRLESLDLAMADSTLLTGRATLPFRWNFHGQTGLLWSRPFALSIQTTTLDFSKLPNRIPSLPTLPIRGEGMVQLDARGTLTEPIFEFQSSLRDVTYQGTLAGETFDVEGLSSNVRFRYDGSASGRDQLSLAAGLKRLGHNVFTLQFSSRLPLASMLERTLRGRGAAVDWQRWFATHPVELKLDIGALDLAKLPIPPMTRAEAEGTLSAELRLSGTSRAPSGRLSMNLDDFGWNQYRDVYLTFESKLGPRRLTLDHLNLVWDSTQLLRAQGAIPVSIPDLLAGDIDRNPPLDLTVELLPFSIRKLSAIDYSFTRFSGDLSGYLTLRGRLRDPEIRSRFAAVDARLGGAGRGTIGLELQASDDRVEARTFVCDEDRRVLAGYVDVPVLLDPIAIGEGQSPLLAGELDGRIEGRRVPLQRVVPAALFPDLISGVRGQLDIDATLAGTWEEPRPKGSLKVRKGAMTLVDFGRRLENVRLDASLDRRALTIDTIAAESLEGSIRGQATLQVEGLYPGTEAQAPDAEDFRASFEADQFDISGFAPNTTALITSKFDIDGSVLQSPRRVSLATKGLDVRLPEGGSKATYATKLNEDIRVLTGADARGDVVPEIDSALVRGGSGSQQSLTLRVETDRDSWLRHPNGDLNFRADIGVRVLGSRTLLSGQIDSIRGDFDFLGREFQVPDKEGIVQFTGAYPPDPLLAVEAFHPMSRAVASEMAEAQSGDPRIIVEVGGRATQPELEMRSDPPLSETEIIFVLMTGRPPSSANPGEDEGAASQAVAAASGVFSGLLQQKLAGTLPVDVLRVQTGEKGFSDSRIKVGKYITSNLFVSYSYFFGAEEDESNYEARVEYHFLPRWMVAARYGQNNLGGFNVFWDVY